VDAFDDVLRNRRDAVPPQAFYERLVQILARRRDPLPLPRAERELAERQAAAAADDAAAEGPRLQKDRTPADQTPKHALALTTAAADERLVRLAVDVFRRVHAEHPATALVRPAARLPFVRTLESTWTPLDSARRGGAGVVADREAGDAAGVHARGHRADWARFQALVRAAAGDDADLTQLCETRRAVRTRRRKNPFRAGAGGSGDAESDWDSDWDSDDEDETRRRKRERATAGASSDQRRAERAERRVVRDEAAASEPAASEATRASSRPRRLGAALLFLHACRVFAEDADARLAAFEARIERRLADLRAARRGGSGGGNARARADGAAGDHSPVPDSQSPGGAGAFAFAADASDEDEKGAGDEKSVFGELNLNRGGSDARAAFAASLPRNALLYRLVADHAPSDAERAVLFRTLLALAATATDNSETDNSETDNSETADNSWAEDVSPRALAAAAHALLARFGALFDAAELAGGDRRLVGYKRQLEEETFRSFRDATGPAALRRRTAHFADARPVAPSHKLSLVRSLLRDAVDNRRKAPGIMRPGLGATRADSAEGGADVLEYVAADARAAVKAQANALGGNVKHAEAVATLGAMLGAAAQFVAWTARREKAAAEAAEGEAAEAEAEAERAEAEAERADGEAARARRNARRRGAMVAAASAYAREAGRETAGAEDDADDEARVAAAAAVDAAEGALMSACA